MARSAVVGALRVTIGIDTAAFEAGLNKLEKQLRQVGKRMQAVGKTLSVSLTAPLAVAGTAGIRFAADFEEAMSRARAVLRPTETEFKALSDLALELGRTTKFTAAEAADGIEMLARNGLNAAQILNGAAEATLNLASAAGAELAPAADVMTDLMVNFRIQGEELNKAVDNIAGTLVNSKLAWDDYAAAVGQAAGVAGPMGMSFEDMNAALALTASSFSSGEEAGTSFKNMLMYLAPSEQKARDLIKQLGLEFFDAGGRLRTLAEIAEELRTKLGGLTREAQLQVLGVLFGARSIRSAVRLMEEGAEGVNRIKQQIAEVSAAEMAAARLDNLRGSLLMLKSAVEGLAIAIANSGFLQWLRGVVDWLTEFVRSLINTDPALLRLVGSLTAVAAALGPAILALGVFAAAVGAIGAPVTAVIAAIGAITAAVAAFWPEIKQAGQLIINLFGDIFAAAKEWLADKLSRVFDLVLTGFGKIRDAIVWVAEALGLDDVFTRLRSSATDAVGGIASAVGGQMQRMAEFLREEWRKAGEAITRDSEEVATETANTWITAASRIKQEIEGTRRFDPEAGAALDELKSKAEQVFEATRTAAERLQMELVELHQLFKAGLIDADTYARAIAQAEDRFTGMSDRMDAIGRSLADVFSDAIMGARKLSDGLREVLQWLGRMMLNRAFMQLFGGEGGPPGTTGGLLGKIFSGIFGSAMKFADGGSFTVGGPGGIDSKLVAFRATPGERVTISKKGEDDGGLAILQPRVVVNNYADASVDSRTREDGTLELTVRAIVRDEFGSERMNPIMRNKHGIAPRLRAR
jgi:TP901 family phage tail tape measure protein